MPDLEDRIADLLSDIDDPSQPQAIAAAQEAVRLAELLRDEEHRVVAHCMLLTTCVLQGRMREAVVELAWLLKHRDAPAMAQFHEELVHFASHLAGSVAAMPSVPRSQVLAIEKDVLDYLRDHGIGNKSLLQHRALTRWRLGELAAAEKFWKRYRIAVPSGAWKSREASRDCICAAELTRGWFRLDSNAVVRAARGVKSDPRSPEERETAFGSWGVIALPAIEQGNFDLAREACNRALRYIKGLPLYTGVLGEIAAVLYMCGHQRKALNLIERYFTWPDEHGDGEDHFYWFAGLAMLFTAATRKGPHVKMRLPKSFELHNETGAYDCAMLASWATGKARHVTDAFRTRNRNNHWGRMLDWRLKLAKR
jgi:hypothetical protein